MHSQSKIRICFVISSLANSGPVSVLLNTVKYLDKSQFDIHIITLYKENNHSRLDDFKKQKLTLWQSTLAKKKILSVYLKLKSSLKKAKPNVVHSHCVRSLKYLTYTSGEFKKIHTIHMHPMQFFLLKYGKIMGRLMAQIYFQGYRKMDKVITCANHFEDQVKKNGNIKTIAIQNGVDTSVFTSVSLEKKAALKKKAGYESKVIYLMNNRLSPEKNNAFVIDNFPDIRNIQLIIIGNGVGKERDGLDSMKRPNVTWIQYTDNVLPYLQMSDYYISASRAEGLPNAVLEAMSCGIYPILSDIASHREVMASLEHDLIFSLDSKKDFQGKIEDTMSSKKQPSAQFRGHIENNFSAPGMANLYEKLYRELSVQN